MREPNFNTVLKMDVAQPLVSIISPTYNHEKFIGDCIESVLAQTYSNWEMIIIDDGSTDNTFTIAKEYAEKYSNIKAFTQKNVGIFRLAESYNFAVSKSSGKYVAILECDDLWLPDKLKIQITALEEQPQCVLSWGRAYLSSIDLKSDYYVSPRATEDTSLFHNKPVGAFLRRYIFHVSIPALTIVIRKDILKEIGGFQQGFNLPLVDIPTILEFLMRGEFAYVNEPLGRWRIYPHQVTKTYTGEGAKGYYLLVNDLMKRFPSIFESHEFTKKEIDDYFKSFLVLAFSRSGRYKLIRKNFVGARSDYWFAIKHGGFVEPVWKIRAIIGIICSYFHMDVEWLAKFLGKESYKI